MLLSFPDNGLVCFVVEVDTKAREKVGKLLTKEFSCESKTGNAIINGIFGNYYEAMTGIVSKWDNNHCEDEIFT